jgi:hypothetical protein
MAGRIPVTLTHVLALGWMGASLFRSHQSLLRLIRNRTLLTANFVIHTYMNDAINGILELVGALFLLNNCRLLYQHKRVQGVSVAAPAFFTGWGLWNLYFYPAQGLWVSFAGGLCLAWTNILWVSLALHYNRRTKTVSCRVIRELPLLDLPAAPTHF